jgi:hypothetical protein
MKPCHHPVWLNLCLSSVRHDEAYLEVTDRLRNVLKLASSDSTPSLFLLVGGDAKAVALKELFRVKSRLRRSAHGVQLAVDCSTGLHERPLWIAHGAAPAPSISGIPPGKCHEITRREIRSEHLGGIAHRVYSGLLLPFVDVLCIFADDIGGLEAAAGLLSTWLDDQSRPLDAVRPHVIVLTEEIPLGREQEAAAQVLRTIGENSTRKSALEFASHIEVVALHPRGSVSDGSRYRLLKERMLRASNDVLKAREDAGMLFSASNFALFLDVACKHFSGSGETLGPIEASRLYFPISPHFGNHLANFLTFVPSPTEVVEFAAPVIASSLVRDNYRPTSHCE